MWAAHGILSHSPQLPRQFCHDILKKDPEVLDLLFQCTIIPRPEWYPETQFDSVACEILVLFIHFPVYVIPGMQTKVDGLDRPEIATKLEKEWRAMVECLKIFTRRPGWLENVTAIWSRVENERWEDVQP